MANGFYKPPHSPNQYAMHSRVGFPAFVEAHPLSTTYTQIESGLTLGSTGGSTPFGSRQMPSFVSNCTRSYCSARVLWEKYRNGGAGAEFKGSVSTKARSDKCYRSTRGNISTPYPGEPKYWGNGPIRGRLGEAPTSPNPLSPPPQACYLPQL